jgi:hypothetical protein
LFGDRPHRLSACSPASERGGYALGQQKGDF